MKSEIVTQKCIKRILKDLKNLDVESLKNNNIYYYHDEENIMKGYVMIIGPQDTLYEYGYYFFEINFTNEYPFKPPKVIYKTNDGETRFHPNLYRSGKVCLSLLNTWRGESWSSCQTLTSVLLTLVTLLVKEPFLNEPGIRNNHPQYNDYHNIIEFKNIQHSILYYLKSENLHNDYKIFYPIIIEEYHKNKDNIIKKINYMIKNHPKKHNVVNIYNMTSIINYNNLKINIDNINI